MKESLGEALERLGLTRSKYYSRAYLEGCMSENWTQEMWDSWHESGKKI